MILTWFTDWLEKRRLEEIDRAVSAAMAEARPKAQAILDEIKRNTPHIHEDDLHDCHASLERYIAEAERLVRTNDVARIAAMLRLLALLKYFGDGLRWFGRRDGHKPHWLVLAVEDYEREFGKIEEAANVDVMVYSDRYWKR